MEKEVRILIENISRGAYSEDNKEANDAIKVLASKDPGLLDHLQDIVKGVIGSAGGNITGSWIMAFINALPR